MNSRLTLITLALLMIPSVLLHSITFQNTDKQLFSPKPSKYIPCGEFSYKGINPLSPPVYNEVTDGVMRKSTLVGGGRKLIRHPCDGEDPETLEAVLTKDEAAGFSNPTILSALSSDNGISWMIAPVDLGHFLSNDQGHLLSFCNDLTYIAFQRGYAPPDSTEPTIYFADDLYKCMQAFAPPLPIFYGKNYLQQVMVPVYHTCTIYGSLISFLTGNPYDTYFIRSTDSGQIWSSPINISETIGTAGFDASGWDGSLMMDADGDFITALAFVVLDDTWAETNGFLPQVTYPAYTQSTDGGVTWIDLRLIFDNDGSAYPGGHTNDETFNATVHYIGGIQEAGFTALNNVQDNVALTPDGLSHLTFTMNDTTYGYSGVWHVLVDNGSISYSYVGFPEDSSLSGESGFAFMPSLANADDGHVVVGWTEFVQPESYGDICMNVIPVGQLEGLGPINVTQTPSSDETYQRIVDRIVPTANPNEYYIDWLFLYYGEGGNSADSTLWHLQTTLSTVGIRDKIKYNSSFPKANYLSQNYPNPFNPMTTISFDIPGETGKKQHAALTVYDLRGRHVKTLIESELEPGTHEIHWDGTNDRGESVSSGIYLYSLRAGDQLFTRKMAILK